MSEANDITVLHPDRSLLIGDPAREVTVQEFRFLDGMAAQRIARPIIDRMVELFGEADPDKLSLEDIRELFADHAEAFVSLMMLSTDLEQQFIEQLSDADGQLLLNTFWQVNSLFFIRRLLARIRENRAGRKGKPSPGDASTQP